MATLHLVNRTSALAACLAVAADNDTVLLLEDGVYAAASSLAPERLLHVLEPDVRARGLTGRLAASVDAVSDSQFVTLVETHQPVVTWR